MKQMRLAALMLGLMIFCVACSSGAQEEASNPVDDGNGEVTEQQPQESEIPQETNPVDSELNPTEEPVQDVTADVSLEDAWEIGNWYGDVFLQWAGLAFLYNDGFETTDFDDVMKAEMIAYAETLGGYGNGEWVPWSENEMMYYISPERVDEIAMGLFGEDFDGSQVLSAEHYSERMVTADEEGGLVVSVGDWGLCFPQGQKNVVETSEDSCLLELTIEMYDAELQKIVQTFGTVNFLLTADEEAANGYYITDVWFEDEYVNYMDAESWEGENTVYESPLGYTMEIPQELSERLIIVNNEDSDYFICALCEEENYEGILCILTTDPDEIAVTPHDGTVPEGMVAVYPLSEQYDVMNEEKVAEYEYVSRYLSGMLATVSLTEE